MLTQNELQSILHYNSETGIFTRKLSTSNVKIGSIAGYENEYGYIKISINYKSYLAHRLAWIYVYGTINKECIDHINGIKSDNRLCNLREASRQENNFNRKQSLKSFSGYKGVTWHKRDKQWRAQCTFNKKTIQIGCFDNAEKASEAYQNFVKELHGNFYLKRVNHG
jgi:hypothetical protein